jgi:guanylate kinase
MTNTMNRLLIFAAPSGAGKTTLVKHVLANYTEKFAFSISACTRPQREGETAGIDYHFMPIEEFKARIAKNEFVEYEEVYQGQFYGTLKSEVQRIWSEGKTVLFDIDVKGAMSIKKLYPKEATSVFVNPPSIEVLLQRLKLRQTETNQSLRKRIDKAKIEMAFAPKFDIILMNDDLQKALSDTNTFIENYLHKEDNSTK